MKAIRTTPHYPTEMGIENVSDIEARITVYPFEKGYGITVAHPLRRVLLSSSVGFAPIAVKIEGVAHEFDSIRGMLEDVTEFIINLKNIRFRLKQELARAVVNYKFFGPREVKGIDLENDEVEIVTPENYLVTLNEDANFEFTLIIERGMGYVPSEEIREIVKEEGFIPLDAFFMPVQKAIYNIENVLIEDNPNFEKVIFNIKTDGQVDPVTVFKNAIDTFYRQMAIFNKSLNLSVDIDIGQSEDDTELEKLMFRIDELELSARSFNCLDRANIKYIGEIALMSESDLMKVKNLGKKSLDEIKDKLEEIGFPAGTKFSDKLENKFKKKLTELKGS